MKILVCGASWQVGSNLQKSPDDIDPFNWTKQLAQELSADVTNASESGTSADFVVRTVISKCEVFDYDIVLAIIPALNNRREIIMRDESDASMKYQHIPLSGVPGKPMNYATGKFISHTKQNILDHFDGYIKNEYEDYSNSLKNIILLGQYLKNKDVKHIMMFDVMPSNFKFTSECSLSVNQQLTTMTSVTKNYISYQETLLSYVMHDDSLTDNTGHPSLEGHKFLGKLMAKRISEL